LCYANILLKFFFLDKMNVIALIDKNFIKYGDILRNVIFLLN
jgi:hypothetical protein